MIDKSIRPDYVMQVKVKNYLGKQKMVKAPKKWKSAPNHTEKELAYITKAEKDALVKMNLHGSMRGKAHKGPSGIISLNGWGDRGDTSDRSYGGGNVSGGGDNRDYGGGAAAEARSARAAAAQEAARVAAVQANEELTRQREMKELIAQQQEEKYDVPVDPTKFGETISDIDRAMSIPESERTIEDKLAIEEWEKDQDYEKVKELADRGESFKDIQSAMDKGLLMKQNALNRQSLIDRGLATIKPTTKLESKLLPTMTKEGLTGYAKDSLGKMAFNLGAKKLGLGSILSFMNPALLAASFFTKGKTPKSTYDLAKTLKSNIQTPSSNIIDKRTSAIDMKPDREDRDGENLIKQVASGENVIAKAINQYRGTEAEAQIANLVKTNLNQALHYYSMMTPKIEAGKANKQEMDAYELLGYYLNEAAPKQQDIAYGGRVDKALTGRSRDI